MLLCGSSASCPLLVTLEADRVKFPLQNHSPHLNGTKYKTRRLPVNPFLDTNVSTALMLANFLPNCTEAQEKLITFCVGMNPRKYSSLAQAVQEETGMFSAFHYGNLERGMGSAGSPALLFWDKLLTKMSEKLESLCNNQDDLKSIVDAHQVMDTSL